MIRIKVCESETQSNLLLEGELSGAFALEVERCWHQLIPYNPVVLDLSGVLHIDRIGRRLLQQMYADGVMFTGARLSIQDVLETIEGPQFPARKGMVSHV